LGSLIDLPFVMVMGDIGTFVTLLDRIYPAMRGAGMDRQDFVLSFNLSRRKLKNQIASREGKWRGNGSSYVIDQKYRQANQISLSGPQVHMTK